MYFISAVYNKIFHELSSRTPMYCVVQRWKSGRNVITCFGVLKFRQSPPSKRQQRATRVWLRLRGSVFLSKHPIATSTSFNRHSRRANQSAHASTEQVSRPLPVLTGYTVNKSRHSTPHHHPRDFFFILHL